MRVLEWRPKVKLSDEMKLKLNRASGLLLEVQNELMRQDETKPVDERNGFWRRLEEARGGIVAFILSLKENDF